MRYLLRYFSGFGKSINFILGEDQFAIKLYIKNTLALSEKFHLNVIQGTLKFGSQTDRLWFVVSLRAVMNINFSSHAGTRLAMMNQSIICLEPVVEQGRAFFTEGRDACLGI